MAISSYKDLVVWQRAMELVVAVYELTGSFPASEMYTLTAQMRRSAISVPSNIAEGSRRSSRKDCRHFILTAFGSASELETQTEIAKRLNFGEGSTHKKVCLLLEEVLRMLNRMNSSLQTTHYKL